MTKTALELYLYMNSSDPIIQWLEEENVQTVEEAKARLLPFVKGNIAAFLSTSGGSLRGTSDCLNTVIKHFEIKNESFKDS